MDAISTQDDKSPGSDSPLRLSPVAPWIGAAAKLMGCFGVGAFIVLAASFLNSGNQLASAPLPPGEPLTALGFAVTAMRVETATFRDLVPVSGSLAPREDLVVAPEVEGLRIVEIKVEPGAHVRKGDVLAVLASDTADTGLAQSDAQLTRAKAGIEQAKRQIASAEAQQSQANSALERARQLLKTGTIAQAGFEQRKAAAETAVQAVLSAQEALKQAEADLAQLQAQRRDLAMRKNRTVVQAPVDGVVTHRTARVGAIATAGGEAMFNIVAAGGIELEAEVSDLDIGRVAVGQNVRVTISGFGEATGKVRLIAPEIDRATRLGKIRIDLDNGPPYRVGAFASGDVETAVRQSLSVPASAVLMAGDGPTVAVIESGRVRTRSIVTGIEDGDRVEVRKGLNAGDVIIAKAGPFLHDGDAVNVVLAQGEAP